MGEVINNALLKPAEITGKVDTIMYKSSISDHAKSLKVFNFTLEYFCLMTIRTISVLQDKLIGSKSSTKFQNQASINTNRY